MAAVHVALAALGVVAVLLARCAPSAAAPWAVAPPPASHTAHWPPPGLRYLVERTKFLSEESQRFLGSRLQLTAQEERVNAQLMAWKRREYNVAEADFPPAHSFFQMKPRIERSLVFQFIRRMPKGAVLHIHDFAAANTDFIVKDVAYRDHLWGRVTPQAVSLRFSLEAPGADWSLVKELRAAAPSAEAFDARIKAAFVICNADPQVAYPDQASVWHAFDKRFDLLFSTLTYAAVFRDYFWRTLLDFYEDNVMYVELRGVLPPLFELNGTRYDSLQVAAMYQDVANEFKRVHPDFLGVRLIYAPSRHVPASQVREYLVFFRKLKQAYPDFVAGFDLVSHEDDGNPLIDFVPALLQLRQDLPDVKYFFHAGETNWEQSTTDENLVDAVMLNTTRIGHGFAIDKHPKVMEAVKSRGIAIELNPISNQVLNLVKDLRNHPGAALLADDFPLVVSSDDPGMWDAKGLSYDFYEAFLGMAGQKADLRTLKQLAINSIRYSAMGDVEKEEALAELATRWQRFIGRTDRERAVRHSGSEHDNSISSVEV